MPRRTYLQIIVALAVICLGRFAVQFIDHALAPDPLPISPTVLAGWPASLGPWTGRQLQVDDAIFTESGADVMTDWIYVNGHDDSVVVNLGIWSKYKLALPHPPDLCYPAAGWNLLQKSNVAVPHAGGEPLSAEIRLYERGNERIGVLFWYAIGSNVLVEDGPLRQIHQKLRKQSESLPPCFKVMVQASADTEADARSKLLSFGGLVAERLATIQASESSSRVRSS